MSKFAMLIVTAAVCIMVVGCEEPARRFNRLGLDAYRQGNYRQAMGAFDLAVSNDPEGGDYYFNRGACRQAVGQLNEAISDYEVATKLSPAIIAAWEQMADCYLAKGLPEQAVSSLKASCTANPYTARPFVAVANFYKGRGNLKDAETWLAKAVVSDPDNSEAHREYGQLLLRIGKREKGLEEYRKSLQLKPVQPGLSAEVSTIAPPGDELPPPKPFEE
ncbi:MAG: tetratricopeptide repeat protein [Phycisphaerae bacterium]|nr:tetratricopeptide repeat protein [Phycisphaerae bacterium]